MLTAKRSLRKNIAACVAEIPNPMKQQQISTVVQNLFASELYKKAQSVCIFLSMPGEFDTRHIVEDMFKTKRKCYVPRVESATEMKMLQAFSSEDISSFPLSKWGIPEPPVDGKRDDAMQCLDVDLFLVPGVAFDHSFNRLGHGRGYYDRFLNAMEVKLQARQAKLPPLVGLAFREQMVESVPMEPHDRRLDAVFFAEETHKRHKGEELESTEN